MAEYENKIDIAQPGHRAVIIFTANSGLRMTFRDGCKSIGVPSPEVAESQEECLKALAEHPGAWILMVHPLALM